MKEQTKGMICIEHRVAFHRDGMTLVDVCCARCHCQDHANQFHLLPGRKQFGSVESWVYSPKTVVSYRFVY